jgi:hypothetical protein
MFPQKSMSFRISGVSFLTEALNALIGERISPCIARITCMPFHPMPA